MNNPFLINLSSSPVSQRRPSRRRLWQSSLGLPKHFLDFGQMCCPSPKQCIFPNHLLPLMVHLMALYRIMRNRMICLPQCAALWHLWMSRSRGIIQLTKANEMGALFLGRVFGSWSRSRTMLESRRRVGHGHGDRSAKFRILLDRIVDPQNQSEYPVMSNGKACDDWRSNLPDYPGRAAQAIVPRLLHDMPHVHMSPRGQMSIPRLYL